MIDNINPWLNMQESAQRRIESITTHNIFWVTDLEGKYGFCLQSKNIFESIKSPANLNGVAILKRNSIYNFGELFLILNNKEDWQIFHSLCEDLISITHKYDSDEAMINAVEVRLKRWQQLLKQDRNQDMSLERQMGLFTELLCLRDIITPKIGIEQAITSWVGADFDKQDFLLDNAIIEVKSYRTTKSPIINISSLQQLHSDKEPIFLLTYSLMQSDNGTAIDSIVKDIVRLLENEPENVLNLFDNKLLEYGYIPEIVKTPFYKFIVDKTKAYYVSDSFPKISPEYIKSQIIKVKYSIDLIQCEEFEVEVNSII
jgi:hypothetical protein